MGKEKHYFVLNLLELKCFLSIHPKDCPETIPEVTGINIVTNTFNSEFIFFN